MCIFKEKQLVELTDDLPKPKILIQMQSQVKPTILKNKEKNL